LVPLYQSDSNKWGHADPCGDGHMREDAVPGEIVRGDDFSRGAHLAGAMRRR